MDDPDRFNRVGARVDWLATWTSIVLCVVVIGPLVYVAWQIAGDWYKVLMVFGGVLTALCFYIMLEGNNRHWGVTDNTNSGESSRGSKIIVIDPNEKRLTRR